MVKTFVIAIYVLLYTTSTEVRHSPEVTEHKVSSTVEAFTSDKECQARAEVLRKQQPKDVKFRHACAHFNIQHNIQEEQK